MACEQCNQSEHAIKVLQKQVKQLDKEMSQMVRWNFKMQADLDEYDIGRFSMADVNDIVTTTSSTTNRAGLRRFDETRTNASSGYVKVDNDDRGDDNCW